jgi:hypothetical protein
MEGVAAQAYKPAQWEMTPKWHPRYWIGHRWRKVAGIGYDPDWDYQTNKQRAHQILREQFDGSKQSGVHGASRQGGTNESAQHMLNATRRG